MPDTEMFIRMNFIKAFWIWDYAGTGRKYWISGREPVSFREIWSGTVPNGSERIYRKTR